MTVEVPIILFAACVMSDGANVHRAGLGSFGREFDPEEWPLERGSVRSELDAASACAIQDVARGEFVLTHHLCSQGSDLPWRSQRASFVGVMKQQTFGSGGVLSQFNQPFCACVGGSEGVVQKTTSELDDVRSCHERFKRDTCGCKGRFCAFFTVKNADDADHVAFGVLVDSVNGENG